MGHFSARESLHKDLEEFLIFDCTKPSTDKVEDMVTNPNIGDFFTTTGIEEDAVTSINVDDITTLLNVGDVVMITGKQDDVETSAKVVDVITTSRLRPHQMRVSS